MRLRISAEDIATRVFPCVLLLLLIAWLGVMQPFSLSIAYVQNTIALSVVLILIAFGQAIVNMTGGLDLSVPGLLSLVNTIAATQMGGPGRSIAVALILLALGWLPGLINGLLIVYGGMQSFIVTLAMWFIWGGIAIYVLPNPGGDIDPTVSNLLQGQFLGIQGTTWLVLVLIVVGRWFERTRLGLSIRALGSDRASAIYSGIPVAATELAAYALSSWFTVLAAVVLSFQSLSGEPLVGNNYVLPMVTAVVVGGVSLSGGKGSQLGPIIGALVLAYLTGVTFSFQLQPQWNQIFQGALLVVAVSMTFILQWVVRLSRRNRAP